MQTIQLQMASPSGNTVPPDGSGSVTQVINIANPQKVCPTLAYVTCSKCSFDVYIVC